MKVVFCVFYYLLIVSNVFVAEEEGKKKSVIKQSLNVSISQKF
jgi:hypothetical protein